MHLTVPDYLTRPTDRYEVATNIAHVLMANGKGIFDQLSGKMPAKEQRRAFGVKLGKGTIVLDGENDEVAHYYQTCFGADRERSVWMSCNGEHAGIGRNFWSPLEDTPHEKEINAAKEWF